jgi:redox-sensitive bicupin YhaK (pirin superfamily)
VLLRNGNPVAKGWRRWRLLLPSLDDPRLDPPLIISSPLLTPPVRQGIVDHADSTGAGARYSKGDSQWVTAGGGVVHSEMFPMIHDDKPNPMELYQIWLNLPAKSKFAPAQFVMFWDEETPIVKRESVGGVARVAVIAGKFEETAALPPPAASWASEPDADVAVWIIDLEPGAAIKLPAPNRDTTKRMLYVHGGDGVRVTVAGLAVDNNYGFLAEPGTGPEHRLLVKNVTKKPAAVLLLQGAEIGEPVAKQGPFVMNTQEELQQAYADYRRTKFGGWKWGTDEPVYEKDAPRFLDVGKGRVYPPNH